MSYARQFAWNAALTVATTLVTGALFYVLRIVLFKGLPKDDYGLLYVLFSYATVVQTVVTFGFDPGLVPYITRFREEDDPGGIKSLALGALVPQGALMALAVAAFLIVPPLASPWVAAIPQAPASLIALVSPVSQSLFRVLALHAIFVLIFRCGQQVLLGIQSMAWRNAGDIARAVVCVGGAWVLLRAGWGVYGAAVAYTLGALAEVVFLGLALVISHRDILRARCTWRPGALRDAFGTGKWLTIAFGGIVVFSSVDTLIISVVRPQLADAAAYQIALPTITILYSLMLAAGISLLPTVRTLWLRGESALLTSGIERLYTAAVVVMVPTGILLAAESDVVMTLLFGKNVLNASDAFDVLAVGGIAFFLAYLNLHVLAGIDQPRAAGVAVLSGLACDIVLNVPLTYVYGIRGTAIAGTCGYAVAVFVGFVAVRRLLAVRFPARAAVASACAGGVAGLAAAALRHAGYIAVDRPLSGAICGGALLFASLASLELIGISKLREMFWSVLPISVVPSALRKF